MWKFIKYRFNKAFEKNLLNLIIFFIGLSVLGVIFFSIIIFILQKIGLLSSNNFFTETLWQGFTLFFDQNAIFGLDTNKNNFFDFFFKFSITIFGVLIFSALIGIITNYISNRIESLRTGKTKIEENEHIIFFNFSRRLIPLISELCTAYERKKKSFVVVTNEETLTVMEKINNVIKVPKNITIVARKGYAWQKSLQDIINLKEAKQLIILKPDVGETFKNELECDVEVGKSLASLIASDQWTKNPCKIIAEFHNEMRGTSYLWYCRDIIFKKIKEDHSWEDPSIVSSSNIKNNMLAQCVNTPELQEIYDNIFGYEGSEIYFPNINDPEYKDLLSKHIGKTIKELNYLCDNIIVIGFYHYDPRYKKSRKKILLNPQKNFPFPEDFGMICIAKNEDQIKNELKNISEKQYNKLNQNKIDPKFKEDVNEIKVCIFDQSVEANNEYLTNIINSIINNNYHNNLKSINVYKNKVENNLNEKSFLSEINNNKKDKKDNYDPLLGTIIMHLHTEDKNKHNFLVYKINNGSILEDKINNGDIILNIISTEEIDEKKNLSSIDLSLNHSSLYLTPEIILKRNLKKIVDSKSDVCIIVKRHTSHKLDFITLKHKEIIDQKKLLTENFEKIHMKRLNMTNNLRKNINFYEKDMNSFSENMTNLSVNEYRDDNCYIFLNETNQQIQKFRDNPTEDHQMINNFISFSNLSIERNKMADHSLITEINGYRTKQILEEYKLKYFSPYIGCDIIEMNSIISKYIAASTFDIINSDLIRILFSRCHAIKANTLLDEKLKTSFRELENYFREKNETLIGIIDYDFDDSTRRRKINNISINPNQIKEVTLGRGDRLITIANFNDLEMMKQTRYLHIL